MATPQLESDSSSVVRVVLGATLSVALVWLLSIGGAGFYSDFTCDLHPVAGTVHVDGRVPVGAQLEFHRYDSDQWVVTTLTPTVGADGRFQVTSIGARTGAPAGDYIVTVRWTPQHLGMEGFETGPEPIARPLCILRHLAAADHGDSRRQRSSTDRHQLSMYRRPGSPGTC